MNSNIVINLLLPSVQYNLNRINKSLIKIISKTISYKLFSLQISKSLHHICCIRAQKIRAQIHVNLVSLMEKSLNVMA